MLGAGPAIIRIKIEVSTFQLCGRCTMTGCTGKLSRIFFCLLWVGTSRFTPGRPHTVAQHAEFSLKNFMSASAVAAGCSSGKKCPALNPCPLTSSAQAFQMPIGPPSSSYHFSSAPLALHRTRTGQPMRRPEVRSARSCWRSRAAAARYSSQIAWACAGSCNARSYASRTSGEKADAGVSHCSSASFTIAGAPAVSKVSGKGAGWANSDHGQNARANRASALFQASMPGTTSSTASRLTCEGWSSAMR